MRVGLLENECRSTPLSAIESLVGKKIERKPGRAGVKYLYLNPQPRTVQNFLHTCPLLRLLQRKVRAIDKPEITRSSHGFFSLCGGCPLGDRVLLNLDSKPDEHTVVDEPARKHDECSLNFLIEDLMACR